MKYENQAPNGNLKFTKRIENDDLYLSCSCAINNPSVWYSPDIKYNLEIKVTRTGSVRLTGKHGQFPAFEFGRHQISAKKLQKIFGHTFLKTVLVYLIYINHP